MLKTIFDPIVLQIQALVEKQIRSVPETLEVKVRFNPYTKSLCKPTANERAGNTSCWWLW